MANILVVEDEIDVCETYEAILSMAGHSVTCLYTASSALSYLVRHVPDMVILDMQLQNSSGLLVLTFIRRHPQLKKKPVLIASGHDDRAENACALWGANAYLTKPIEIAQLQSVVASQLTMPAYA